MGGKKWVRTGDICFIDKKGLIHYKSRLKRMIITNGYNVYPSHVEDVIMELPSVKACSVIGKPDKTHGEKVIAFVVLNEGYDSFSEKNKIQKHLKEHLAKYEVPKDIKYIEELPKTLVGKVAYKELEKLC
jgi:long-chain acyl-CoA synthetase